MEELLKEFIEWAENCGEDAFFMYDNRDECIKKFIKERSE